MSLPMLNGLINVRVHVHVPSVHVPSVHVPSVHIRYLFYICFQFYAHFHVHAFLIDYAALSYHKNLQNRSYKGQDVNT